MLEAVICCRFLSRCPPRKPSPHQQDQSSQTGSAHSPREACRLITEFQAMRPLLHHDAANRVVGPQDWHVLPVKIRSPAFVPKIGQDHQSSGFHPRFNSDSSWYLLSNLGLAATFLRQFNRSFDKCGFAEFQSARNRSSWSGTTLTRRGMKTRESAIVFSTT